MAISFSVILLIHVALGISLAKESLLSLALPDGDGLEVDGHVRDEDLIGHGVARMPVIGAGTRQRHVYRLVSLQHIRLLLLDALRLVIVVYVVVIIRDVVVDIVVVVVIIVMTVVAVEYASVW